MKISRFFLYISVLMLALSANAEYYDRDDYFGYFPYGEDNGQPTVVVSEILDVPQTGILEIPEYLVIKNDDGKEIKSRVIGIASFCQKTTNKFIDKLILNKSFRFIGIHQYGYEIPGMFYSFHEWGSSDFINSIEVAEGNQYYKSEKGMLLSHDGTTIFYLPPDLITAPRLEIPDGVESVVLDYETVSQLFYGGERYPDRVVVCPASLRKADYLFYKTKAIFLKSDYPVEGYTDTRIFGYNDMLDWYEDQECKSDQCRVYVPKGSIDKYKNSTLWEYMYDKGYIYEMDYSKPHTVNVVADDELQFMLNGKTIKSITVNPAEEVVFQGISGEIRDRIFEDNTNKKGCLDEEMCYKFYPVADTELLLQKRDVKWFNDQVTGLTCESVNGKVTIHGSGDYKNIKELVIPSTVYDEEGKLYKVEAINEYAFCDWDYNGKIETLKIEEGIEKIGWGAFEGNVKLSNVELPSTLNDVDGGVFSGSDLKRAVIGPFVNKNIFANCGGEDGIIDEVVLEAGPMRYRDDIPLSRKLICKRDFRKRDGWAQNLSTEELVLEYDNAKIDATYLQQVESSKMKLKKISFKGNNIAFSGMFKGNSLFEPVECTITDVSIEADEVKMSDNIFLDFKDIENIEVKANTGWELGCGSLQNLSKVTHLDLSDVEGSVPAFSVAGMTNLQSIVIGDRVENIHSVSLAGNKKLKRVEFKNGSKPLILGNQVFMDSPIEEIKIDRDIADYYPVFFGMKSLRKLEIGSNVTTIPAYAFADCVNLTEIFCESSLPPYILESTFRNVPVDKCKVYVKGGDGEYREAGGWKEFFRDNVENVNKAEVKVYSRGGDIVIEGGAGKKVVIYSISGIKERQIDISVEKETISMPANMYVILVDNQVYKLNHQ